MISGNYISVCTIMREKITSLVFSLALNLATSSCVVIGVRWAITARISSSETGSVDCTCPVEGGALLLAATVPFSVFTIGLVSFIKK